MSSKSSYDRERYLKKHPNARKYDGRTKDRRAYYLARTAGRKRQDGRSKQPGYVPPCTLRSREREEYIPLDVRRRIDAEVRAQDSAWKLPKCPLSIRGMVKRFLRPERRYQVSRWTREYKQEYAREWKLAYRQRRKETHRLRCKAWANYVESLPTAEARRDVLEFLLGVYPRPDYLDSILKDPLFDYTVTSEYVAA